MRKLYQRLAIVFIVLSLMGLFIVQNPVRASSLPQQPTSVLPTVTGTPSGPMAVVKAQPEPQINLRSGPNTKFDKIGVLLVGQKVPAKGKSPGGEWIEVEYPGVPGGVAWVFALYVDIVPPVDLPIIEPPSTPTPLYTNTVDPTLAAKFLVTVAPTRLPTFTAPPPLSIPTFTAVSGSGVGNLPMGFIILGLAALGVLLGVIALVQGR